MEAWRLVYIPDESFRHAGPGLPLHMLFMISLLSRHLGTPPEFLIATWVSLYGTVTVANLDAPGASVQVVSVVLEVVRLEVGVGVGFDVVGRTQVPAWH